MLFGNLDQTSFVNVIRLDGIPSLQIQHNFYPSVEALLRRVTRCSRVHVFEELVRHGKVESSTVLNKSATAGEPLPHCHVDFS